MSRLNISAAFRAHGAMLVALSLAAFVLVGICATTFTLLHDRLMEEFQWKNATVSSVVTVYSLAAMLSGPLVGQAIDKWGAKPVMFVGTTMVVVGYLVMSRTHSLSGFYVAFLLTGVGYGGAFYLASSTIIAAQMGEQKSLFMGIWMLAGSSGAAVFTLVATWAIAHSGWRNTAVGAAVLVGCVLPLIALLVSGQRRTSAAAQLSQPTSQVVPWQLLLAPHFLLLSFASAFASFGISATYNHSVPILVAAGFSAKSAGAIIGSTWIVSGLGSLALGAVSNRFGVANIFRLSLLCSAIGTLALLVSASAAIGMAAAIFFVILWGTTANALNQFLPILIVERFGPIHLGLLLGVQGALMGVIGSFAPMVSGALFDKYGSYNGSIVVSVAAIFLAIVLAMCVRNQRRTE